MFSDNELIAWNQLGFLVGPQESAEEFLIRVQGQPDLRRAIVEENQRLDLLRNLKYARGLLESLFKTIPSWITVEPSSKGLLPWEGAMTLIEETKEGVVKISIQIKPKHFLAEVVAHEMVHAMRVKFSESRFEEILAYQTSSHLLRRYFGPIFNRTGEVKFWLLLFSLAWFFPLIELFFDVDIPLGGWYSWAPSIVTLGCYLYRLIRSQSLFQQCLQKLKTVARVPEMALPIALRLTDEEIEQFATSSPRKILKYASLEKEKSLRWRQIALSYFSFDEGLNQF